jgi:hypothetical protein
MVHTHVTCRRHTEAYYWQPQFFIFVFWLTAEVCLSTGRDLRAYTGVLVSPEPDQEGNKLQRQKILMFIYPIYYHNWKNISTIYIYIYTQGVSRLVDITAGGDFLGLCDQKSSYKHVCDFGRLRSYGHFLIPLHALVWTASYGTSWRVMYSAW